MNSASIPDTRLSDTLWLWEYIGLAFVDGLNAEIVFLDENNETQILKGEYLFFNEDTGGFYFDSIHNYVSVYSELEDSYKEYKEAGVEILPDDLKLELFLRGGIELLFRLENQTLEIFGSFEKGLETNVYFFKVVTLQELQEVFIDYR